MSSMQALDVIEVCPLLNQRKRAKVEVLSTEREDIIPKEQKIVECFLYLIPSEKVKPELIENTPTYDIFDASNFESHCDVTDMSVEDSIKVFVARILKDEVMANVSFIDGKYTMSQ